MKGISGKKCGKKVSGETVETVENTLKGMCEKNKKSDHLLAELCLS